MGVGRVFPEVDELVDKIAREQYLEGLDEGKKAGWNAAIRILAQVQDGGFSRHILHEIFSDLCFGTISELINMVTPDEAIKKITEFEASYRRFKYERGDKVQTLSSVDIYGTEVFPAGTVGTIIDISCENSDQPYVVSANGDYWYYAEDRIVLYTEEEKKCGNDSRCDYIGGYCPYPWLQCEECEVRGSIERARKKQEGAE